MDGLLDALLVCHTVKFDSCTVLVIILCFAGLNNNEEIIII